MKLMDAWNREGRTDNNMKTNYKSESSCLDFFFLAGASRGKDISNLFMQAAYEDLDLAGRILLWMRDIRGGAGEREGFRNILHWVASHNYETTKNFLPFVPEVGRWDDLLVLHDTPFWPQVVKLIYDALMTKNGLCAKWMPRKGPIAYKLRNSLDWSPKYYRKTLVELTKVVETQMCANEWGEIIYSHVPSRAASIYRKAFKRHDEKRYTEYLENVKTGTEKIHAATLFPHDIVKACLQSSDNTSELQWRALPNYMEKTEERVLPVCDVSGSMSWTLRALPLHVSISLGLYISERNEGPFRDVVCTFSQKPSLVKLKTIHLRDRIRELNGIHWGGNTDLLGVFTRILETATFHRVPEKELPSMVLIISDMEFDRCARWDDTAIKGIKRRYKATGYKLPKVVFWNVNGRLGNVPVLNSKGVALVSGFSPSILTSLLSSPENFTPKGIMLSTVMKDKYNWLSEG